MSASIRAPTCPACGNSHARCKGEIPNAIEFAGRELDRVLPGGNLWACDACALHFRYPRLSQNELDRMYRLGNEEAWDAPAEARVDWSLARGLLNARAPSRSTQKRILDIGCWDGRFLGSIEPGWQLNGVEINPAAAARARQRGVDVLSEDLARIDSRLGLFDVITAFDVIEHVPDPLHFVRTCAALLSAEGTLIIATGDTESWPWRILGSRHLYCIWPEHLSFINRSWCSNAARTLGLKITSAQSYRRTEATFPKIAIDSAKSLLYAAWPQFFGWLRVMGIGNAKHVIKQAYPPLWPTAKDHMLVCFSKGVA